MSNSGLNFAQSQLEKYGWSEGKGLGRNEGGITEAIKPKLKFNSTGLGYDMGEQFKFHWWDHVFNKAADNIIVGKDQSGSVQVQHTQDLEVSTKRPSLNKTKSKFYGGFVKGATLVVGQGEKDESDSSDEELEKDKSLRLSDQELFKICKGRTAHKGARHGLNMTAKLARVREQELLLMQAWGAADSQVQEEEQLQPLKKKKKSHKNKDLHDVMHPGEAKPKNGSKSKKKRKSERVGAVEQDVGREEYVSLEHIKETHEPNPLKKKKKKRDKTKLTDDCNSELCTITTHKKKKKRKKEKIEIFL